MAASTSATARLDIGVEHTSGPATEQRIAGEVIAATQRLAPSELGHLTWIYENSDVSARDDEEDGSVTLRLRATRQALADLKERLGGGG